MPKQEYYGDKYNQGGFKDDKDKTKTEGQRLEESGQYLKDPDTEVDTSQPLQSKSFEIDPNRKPLTQRQKEREDRLRQRAGSGQQGADIAKKKLPKSKQTDLPQFLQVHKEADPIIKEGIAEDMAQNVDRDKAIKDVINSTEPKSQERLQGLKDIAQQLGEDSLGYGLMALQKYGEAIDWTNDQVNLRNNLPSLLRGVETPFDALLDYSYKDLRDDIAGGIGNVVGATTGSETANTVAETGAQILLPDAMDFRTGGLGYLDNIGRAALKLRKADGKFINDAVNFADNLVFQIRQQLGGKGNLELAGIGMRINKNNITDTFYQSKKINNTSGGAKSKGFADPTGQSSSKFYNPEYGDVLANANPENVKLLKKIKLTDDESRFVLDNYYKIDRDTSAAIEDLYSSVDEFNDTKDKALPYLLEAWSNIKRKRTPQLDHVNQLKAALPFFNNAKVKEFPGIAKILMEEGIFGGHSRKNFKYLEFDVHSVKSAYWIRKVGGNGEKFFAGKDISTPQKLRAAAKEYAQIINESNRIVNNAVDQYKLMNKTDISAAELDEFVNRLGSERIDPKQTVKQVRELLTEMEKDGFIQTPKSTTKIEKTSIKQETKDLKAADKRKETIVKDDASVERRMEEIQNYISTREKTFKGQYPLGLQDEQLHFDAETIVKDMKKNRALRENVQGTIFDQENEAAQIEAMKKILWERTGRSRNK